MRRLARVMGATALLAGSVGAVFAIHSDVAGACPVQGNDGTIWGSRGGVQPVGADDPGLYDLDGDGNNDIGPPPDVPPEQWPGDTNGTATDEKNKTVYVDDRDFTANLDDTLGPGQSFRESQIGGLIGNPGFNINLVDSRAGDEEGFWLYIETNSVSGLTRGGNHVAFEVTGVDEVPVLIQGGPDRNGDGFGDGNEIFPEDPDPTDPVFPDGVYLFADDPDQPGDQSGFPAGGSLAQTAGEHDPCTEGDHDPATAAPAPDTILF